MAEPRDLDRVANASQRKEDRIDAARGKRVGNRERHAPPPAIRPTGEEISEAADNHGCGDPVINACAVCRPAA